MICIGDDGIEVYVVFMGYDEDFVFSWVVRIDVGYCCVFNEDSVFVGFLIFVVVDGMGGYLVGDCVSVVIIFCLVKELGFFVEFFVFEQVFIDVGVEIDVFVEGVLFGVGMIVIGVVLVFD